MQEKIDFTYLIQPPKRYTFEQPQLKLWVESWCKGKVLNLFAGKVKLMAYEIRNDIDPDMPADYYLDAFEFVNGWTGEKFDTIIFDPPYSIRKSREKYGGRYIGKDTKIKDVLYKVLKPDGRVISFGYSSTGMSKKRGFNKVALCVVCHSGNHDDTIAVVEDKDLIGLVEERAKN